MGYSLAACQKKGLELMEEYYGVEDMGKVHRVILNLFTNVELHSQFLAFLAGSLFLHHYPALFVFVLRYDFLTCVEHWLEGRHRYIKLHGATGSRSPAGPAGQPVLLRKSEAL